MISVVLDSARLDRFPPPTRACGLTRVVTSLRRLIWSTPVRGRLDQGVSMGRSRRLLAVLAAVALLPVSVAPAHGNGPQVQVRGTGVACRTG
jgi:hypothetical protein